MMEATTNNLQHLLIAVCTCMIFLIHIPTCAQINLSDPSLSQLLDSTEILKFRGDFQKALLLCEKVKSEVRNKGNGEILVQAEAEIGDITRNRKDVKGAEQVLVSAGQLARQHEVNDNSVLARLTLYQALLMQDTTTSNDSIALLTIERKFDQAEELMIREEGHHQLKALIFLRKGQFYRSHYKTIKADLYFRRAIQENEMIVNKINYTRALICYDLSSFYRTLGDFERGVLYAYISYYIYSHPLINDPDKALRSKVLVANNYYYDGKYARALEHYNDILEKDNKIHALNPDDKRGVFSNICQALVYDGKFDDAIEKARYAIRLNPGKTAYDNRVLYFTYNTLAEAQELKGDIVGAKKNYEKSRDLRILVHGIDEASEFVFDGFMYFGLFYERLGEYEQAMSLYQKSLQVLFPSFEPKDIYDNPEYAEYENKDWLLYIILYKARTLYKLYHRDKKERDLIASYNLFNEAYKVLDELLNSDNTDEAHLRLFNRFAHEFDLSITCAVNLFELTGNSKYIERTFQFMESNKYFLLVEAVANSQGNFVRGIADSLVFVQRQINKEIASLNVALGKPISEDSAFYVRNILVQRLLDKSLIEETMELEPGNNKISVARENALTIKEVQDTMLKQGEIIIDYYWTDHELFGLLIGKGFVDLVRIKIDNELLQSIDEYKSILIGEHETMQHSNEEYQKFTESSSLLYKQLIKPVKKKVESHSYDLKRLIIVPDHKLSNLPFEAFIPAKPQSGSVSYWALTYLVNEMVISYSYSLNILKSNMEQNFQIENPKLLGLSYSTSMDEDEDIAKLRVANELPYSARELDNISHWIKKSDLMKGDQATEDIFKKTGQSYSLLHLAVHGIADTLDMFESRLIFKRNKDSFEDGLLHAFELYDMDLSQTELAVLSACETGLGKESEGEGIFSIARGFAYAGCPSIMMSLWKVNDKATSNLMDYFYKNLAAGLHKDIALQKAKIEYIDFFGDDGAHPSNWAAFIALGNNKPIHLPKASYFVLYISIVGLILGIVGFIAIRKRKHLI